MEKPGAPPESDEARHAVVLVADIAASGLNEKQISEQTSKMHQKLDEIVYLFDGKVLDPLAPILIAEMPDAGHAVKAARRARAELVEFNQRKTKADSVLARMSIHSGEVRSKDLSLAGRTVEMALSVLDAMLPLQVAVSRDVLDEAAVPPSGEPLLKLGEVEFFDLPDERPVEEAEAATAEIAAEAEAGVERRTATKGGEPRPKWLLPVAGFLVVLAILSGWFLLRGSGEPESVAPTPTPPRRVAPTTNVSTLSIEPFQIEGLASEEAQRITTTRLAVIELLRPLPNIEVITGEGEASARVGVHVGPAPAAAEPEIVEGAAEGKVEEPPLMGVTPFLLFGGTAVDGNWIDVTSEGTAARTLARWIIAQVAPGTRLPGSDDDEAMAHFARAVAMVVERGAADNRDAVREIRAAIEKDPDFLAAHVLAVSLFDAGSEAELAHESLRRAHAIAPDNVVITRDLARRDLAIGNIATGLELQASLLRAHPEDQEALEIVGLYALAINDAPRFRSVLEHLDFVPAGNQRLHEPDLLTATGEINKAVQQYYAIESEVPDNRALSLKIGRLAVLRRSGEIANLELDKLRAANAGFPLQMLNAYIAANDKRFNEMEDALRLARRMAGPGDPFNTWTAEVYAIAGRPGEVLPALEAAVAAGEPTLTLIETNPLFKFLENDPGYRSLLKTIDEKKREIADALASAPS